MVGRNLHAYTFIYLIIRTGTRYYVFSLAYVGRCLVFFFAVGEGRENVQSYSQ